MKTLAELSKQRRKHVKSCRDNGDRSHERIANMYSDPSHFIYELLQNAEDACATEVGFLLDEKTLTVVHDGTPFTIEDIHSITTVGSSTKEGEMNAIGKFGVGFKSVFAVTEAPEIYSGEFSFRIVDFIVPEEINDGKARSKETKFVLPLKTTSEDGQAIRQQIANKLQELAAESLMFMKHVKAVKWKTEKAAGCLSVAADSHGQVATLSIERDGKNCQHQYFLVQGNLVVDKQSLSIAVAFKMADEKVVPLPSGSPNLFVFFPTKESAGLGFLVHAPYKTTPNRETINFSDAQNGEITKALARLLQEGIGQLKDHGLLSVDALSVLPINPDEFHGLYRAMFTQVKSAFEAQPLLPTASRKHARSTDALLARGRNLVDLLKDDAQKLFGRSHWLDTRITENATWPLWQYLTRTLDVKVVDMERFCRELTEPFLASKQDQWLVRFYSAVPANPALYSRLPILRLENGSHICPVDESGEVRVYLPPKKKQSGYEDRTVKRSIASNRKARGFLEALGIKEPDELSEIRELIAPRYDGSPVDEEKHFDDFTRAVEIWSRADQGKKQSVIDILRNVHFVLCKGLDGEVRCQLAKDVYSPTKRLLSWFESSHAEDVHFLHSKQQGAEKGREFLRSLGVEETPKMLHFEPIVEHSHGHHVRSVHGFNPKFDIHGLENALDNMTLGKSLHLWSVLLDRASKLKGHVEHTTNLAYGFTQSEEMQSRAMKRLLGSPWLYDKEGNLIRSELNEISLESLHDKYLEKHREAEALAAVLGIQGDEIKQLEARLGGKFVPNAEYAEFEQWKRQRNPEGEPQWNPDCPAAEAEAHEVPFKPASRQPKELSYQEKSKAGAAGGGEHNAGSAMNGTSVHAKSKGDWGEEVAKKELAKKHPGKEVVWMNENGDVGKGYDFVVKQGEEEIAYYEVKTKDDESPQMVQMTSTQWGWARKLHSEGKGKMYNLMVVYPAGSPKPSFTLINDPIQRWKDGQLDANPVSIEL